MSMNSQVVRYMAAGPRLSLMMFLQFFVWGAWYVTVGNYMKAIGLGDSIGHAYTVGPIAAILSPFFLGMVADRFFPSQRVLGVMHVLGGAFLLAAPAVAEHCVAAVAGAPARAAGEAAPFIHAAHLPFLLILFGHMLCYMPTLGLSNTVCFHNMDVPERQFPMVRVFGTIGWVVAGWAVAMAATKWLPAGVDVNDKAAVSAAVAGSPNFFYVAGGAGVLLGLYSFTLPHTEPPAKGREVTARAILGLDSLSMLKDPSFFVFILCSFLTCIPLAAYYAYAPVFVGAAGFKPNEVPIAMSYGQMSEVFFMLAMPIAFRLWGAKWMLAAGMLAWVVRYGLFAGAAADKVVWMVIAGIVLHGICYDFFFVTGFLYTNRKAPKEVAAQAQGFLVLVTQGLGLGVGAQVMGRVVAGYTDKESGVVDWGHVWLVPAVMAGVVLAVFLILFRDGRKAEGARG